MSPWELPSVQNARELHLLEDVPQNKWVTKAVSKGKFILCGFPDHSGSAGCNQVLSNLHGIEYEMPQAGHQEQVSIRGVWNAVRKTLLGYRLAVATYDTGHLAQNTDGSHLAADVCLLHTLTLHICWWVYGTALMSSKRWAWFSHKLCGSVWLFSGIWTLLMPICSSNTNTINKKNNLKNEESCWEMTLDCHAHCTVPSVKFSHVWLWRLLVLCLHKAFIFSKPV